MANGNRTGLFGGLATGLESGVRLGMLGIQLGQQREALAEQKAQREFLRDNAMFSEALQITNNKNLPGAMKTGAIRTIARIWNKRASAPGTPLADNLLPEDLEWNDALFDYTKRAEKIFTDKTLTQQQAQEGLASLFVEAEGDIKLAPMVEALKSRGEAQLQADTLRYVEMLTSDNAITDDEAVEAATIKNRSPKAVLEAATIVDARVKAQREAAPSKLDAFTDAKGNRILVLQAGEKREQINLGPTQRTADFNLGELRAKLAFRANNQKTGDKKVDAMDPKVAAGILQDLNRTDFLTQLLRGATGGAPQGGGTPQTPEDEAAGFLQGLQ